CLGLFDQLKQLATVHHLHERLTGTSIGYDVNGRRVLNGDALPERAVLFDGISQFALRIEHERQTGVVFLGESLSERAQVAGRDLRLVLEDELTELGAQLRRFALEVLRQYGCVEGPIVLRQGEVVADDGDPVFAPSFFDQRRGAGAVGALQVLKNDQGDIASLRGTQGAGGIPRLPQQDSAGNGQCKQNCKPSESASHYCPQLFGVAADLDAPRSSGMLTLLRLSRFIVAEAAMKVRAMCAVTHRSEAQSQPQLQLPGIAHSAGGAETGARRRAWAEDVVGQHVVAMIQDIEAIPNHF